MIHTFDDFQPFRFDRNDDYAAWREWKLAHYPASIAELMVPVQDPARLTEQEHQAILACCRKANMAIYRVVGGQPADKAAIRELGRQFGLQRLDMNLRADEDSITSIRLVPESDATHYIPYTDHALNWHTDGYYNRLDEQVRGIVMHCVSAAASGGGSLFLDPELAYLLLRDENPDYVRVLMQPDAMTIPANVESGTEIRPAQSGPVFSVENATRSLHMRYTARTRSIEWKDDPVMPMATGFLSELLNGASDCIFRHRLQAGEGIICNNVIHGREAFRDGDGSVRLLYRARYHDRIKGTEMMASNNGEQSCSG
jgi:alpha-ketoglutarate-dependent taurine dioxygenase